MRQAVQRWQSRRRYKRDSGFTIVELLIVIIVIAILATLVITAYNGVQQKAKDTKIKSDIYELIKAIDLARNDRGKTLRQLIGDPGYQCYGPANANHTYPRDLSKSSTCWTQYYSALSTIGQAAGANLDSLKSGDPNGAPYGITGAEGYNWNGDGSWFCHPDYIYVFTGSGTASTPATSYASNLTIPLFSSACI